MTVGWTPTGATGCRPRSASAVGNIALALALWSPGELVGSAAQLGINLAAMVLAGWLTLLVQRALMNRLGVNRWQRDMWQRRGRDMLKH